MSEPNPIVASQNVVVQARPAPAFQANAFFNPGFQTTSHSSMAFQQCAFDATAFQTDPCETPSGRSGYWRLFFTQMQEEALKEYEKKTGEKLPTPQEEVVEEKKTTKKQAKKSVRKPPETVEVFEPIELPKFKRKPIYAVATSYDELANLSPLVYDKFVAESVQNRAIINLEKERLKRRRQARRRAAAFLLMAA